MGLPLSRPPLYNKQIKQRTIIDPPSSSSVSWALEHPPVILVAREPPEITIPTIPREQAEWIVVYSILGEGGFRVVWSLIIRTGGGEWGLDAFCSELLFQKLVLRGCFCFREREFWVGSGLGRFGWGDVSCLDGIVAVGCCLFVFLWYFVENIKSIL